MPIYEYRCAICGHEIEAIQKFGDAALQDCPSCGKPQLKKLVSAAGFQLKGSGWYVTDFKDGGKKKGTPSAEAGAKTDADTTSSKEMKPKKEQKKASDSGGGDQ